MYTPSAFRETDPNRLFAFMERHSFATLVSQADGLTATHLPLLLDRDTGPQGELLGHMARANPQWRQVEGDVLAIFTGPHAYVSPSWYEADDVVPTWNYVAVHAYGPLRLVVDPDELLDLLRRTLARYEGGRPRPWAMTEPAEYLRKLLPQIVGFRIRIGRLEGKWKLSQNRPRGQQERVRAALLGEGGEGAREVAALMGEALRKQPP